MWTGEEETSPTDHRHREPDSHQITFALDWIIHAHLSSLHTLISSSPRVSSLMVTSVVDNLTSRWYSLNTEH